MRGDLYRLRPGKDTAGHEQRGPRYAVAVQSDGIRLSTLIVAPTSTSAQPAIFRPEIEMDGTRTRVLVDQMRAVDGSRLGDFAGRLDAAETGEVDRAIKLILGTLLRSRPTERESIRIAQRTPSAASCHGRWGLDTPDKKNPQPWLMTTTRHAPNQRRSIIYTCADEPASQLGYPEQPDLRTSPGKRSKSCGDA